MKYSIIDNTHPIFGEAKAILIQKKDESIQSFPVEVGNPNYDQFLVDINLTDKKVKALTPDKWYDFPKESA